MNNDEKMNQLLEVAAPHLKAINDLITETNTTPVDIIRALFLIQDVQRISRYGKVGFTIKDGEVIHVWSQQQMISEKELRRNLNDLSKKWYNRKQA